MLNVRRLVFSPVVGAPVVDPTRAIKRGPRWCDNHVVQRLALGQPSREHEGLEGRARGETNRAAVVFFRVEVDLGCTRLLLGFLAERCVLHHCEDLPSSGLDRRDRVRDSRRVVFGNVFEERFFGELLFLGVDRRLDRQPTLHEQSRALGLGFAVDGVVLDDPLDVVAEVRRVLRRGAPRGGVANLEHVFKRNSNGLVVFGLGDVARREHAGEHVVAAVNRVFRIDHRIVLIW